MSELSANSRYNYPNFVELYDRVASPTIEGPTSLVGFIQASGEELFDRIVFMDTSTSGMPEALQGSKGDRDRISEITHVSFKLDVPGSDGLSSSVDVLRMNYLVGAAAPYMFAGSLAGIRPPVIARTEDAYLWAVNSWNTPDGVSLRYVPSWRMTRLFRGAVADYLQLSKQSRS